MKSGLEEARQLMVLWYLYLFLDSTAVSIFVVILVELTNAVFVNLTNITTNIETAVLSRKAPLNFGIYLL